MENDMIQSSSMVFVLVGGLVGLGCGGSERPASDASSVNSPTNTGPDTTTGPGAGEATDVTPNAKSTGANPDAEDDRSTGSTGPDMGNSTATPSEGPVH
jgi:hypothetical protein